MEVMSMNLEIANRLQKLRKEKGSETVYLKL